MEFDDELFVEQPGDGWNKQGDKQGIQEVEDPQPAPPANRPRPRPVTAALSPKITLPHSSSPPFSKIRDKLHSYRLPLDMPSQVGESSPPSSYPRVPTLPTTTFHNSTPPSIHAARVRSSQFNRYVLSSPSNFTSSPSIPLAMQKEKTSEATKSLSKSQRAVLHALDGLVDTCVLCWLRNDEIESRHTAIGCHMEERNGMLWQLKNIQVPVDRSREWMCFHCYLPMKTFRNFNHGTGMEQDKCDFKHILRPFIWASWHFDQVRSDVVARFRPHTPQGTAITGVGDWLDFFKWCFLPSSETQGLMNYLVIFTWACKRSDWFMNVYPNFSP